MLVFGIVILLTSKLDRLGARLCETKTNFINKCFLCFSRWSSPWYLVEILIFLGLGKVEQICPKRMRTCRVPPNPVGWSHFSHRSLKSWRFGVDDFQWFCWFHVNFQGVSLLEYGWIYEFVSSIWAKYIPVEELGFSFRIFAQIGGSSGNWVVWWFHRKLGEDEPILTNIWFPFWLIFFFRWLLQPPTRKVSSIPSLKLTVQKPLKTDGWNTLSFPFGARPIFRCELLVSGRVWTNNFLRSFGWRWLGWTFQPSARSKDIPPLRRGVLKLSEKPRGRGNDPTENLFQRKRVCQKNVGGWINFVWGVLSVVFFKGRWLNGETWLNR